jgi:hypothetical protein
MDLIFVINKKSILLIWMGGKFLVQFEEKKNLKSGSSHLFLMEGKEIMRKISRYFFVHAYGIHLYLYWQLENGL